MRCACVNFFTKLTKVRRPQGFHTTSLVAKWRRWRHKHNDCDRSTNLVEFYQPPSYLGGQSCIASSGRPLLGLWPDSHANIRTDVVFVDLTSALCGLLPIARCQRRTRTSNVALTNRILSSCTAKNESLPSPTSDALQPSGHVDKWQHKCPNSRMFLIIKQFALFLSVYLFYFASRS